MTEDTNLNLLFLLISILLIIIVLIIIKLKKNERILTFNLNIFIWLYLCSVILSSVLFNIFDFYITEYFSIIMKSKSLTDQLHQLGIISNLLTIIKYLLLVIPILILLGSNNYRTLIGIKGIEISKEKLLVLALIVFLSIVIISVIFQKYFIHDDNTSPIFNLYFSITSKNILLWLFTCFAISTSSELFFRGFVYSFLNELLDFKYAIFAESILATLFIVNFDMGFGIFLIIFTFSIIMTIFFQTTKSIFPNISLHFLILVFGSYSF